MKEYRAIGPPGCGKTTWLSRQVEIAVAKYGPDSVLLASLTKAAAAELGSRGLSINQEKIGTLHAHAFRSLDKPANAQDSKHVEGWNAHVSKRDLGSFRLTKSLKQDDMGRASGTDKSAGDDLYEAAEIFRHRCLPVEHWPNERVRSWFEAWQEYKAMTFAMDFTDMIVKATEVIEHAPGNPRFIFLDEAQDLSLLELKLARKWAQHCEIFIMVGDPDQCLFEWRGSSPLNFETPKLDEEFYKYLSQSYRVPAAVHSVAVEWINRIEERRPVEYHPRKDEDGNPVEGKVRRTKYCYLDAPQLAREAIAHAEEGRTVMFLGTAGYMVKPVVKHMKDIGTPFHNPYSTKRGDWNPLGTARFGTTSMAERIRAFAYGDWLADSKELRKWLDTLKLDHFRQSREITSDYLARLSGELTMADLQRILSPEALKRGLAQDYDWLRDGMKAQYKDRSTVKYAIKIAKKHGEATLTATPKIIVGTIHSVKGGEADVVYVFPDLSPAADESWRFKGGDRDGVYRVFYVAMTRAREELVLCQPGKGGRFVKWPK